MEKAQIFGNDPKFVLATSSRTRIEMLRAAGLSFIDSPLILTSAPSSPILLWTQAPLTPQPGSWREKNHLPSDERGRAVL